VVLAEDGTVMDLVDGRLTAVGYVPGSKGRRLIAVGPGGTDSSDDGGATWLPISDEGFHALSISPAGGGVWAVGEQGRIARYR
jgi:hypothetical protein